MKRRVAVRGVVVDDGKLLCSKLIAHDGTIMDFWCVPGGGVDAGEDLIKALERELKEELGVQADVGRLLFVQQFAYKDGSGEELEFFFQINNPRDFLSINLGNTSHGTQEIHKLEFKDPSTTHLLPSFLSTADLEPDASQAVQFFSYL